MVNNTQNSFLSSDEGAQITTPFLEASAVQVPAWFSSPNSSYCEWDSCQALVVARQWLRHTPAAMPGLYENREWICGLVGTLWLRRDKSVLQEVPLHSEYAYIAVRLGVSICGGSFNSAELYWTCVTNQYLDTFAAFPSVQPFCIPALVVIFGTQHRARATIVLNYSPSNRGKTRCGIDLSWGAFVMRMEEQ
jgi:hypothetical protein